MARQSEDALSRAERINKLLESWRIEVGRQRKVKEGGRPSQVPVRLVDLLASNPFITIKKAAEQLRVAFTTAQRGIEKLEKIGVVSRMDAGKRDRVYCAKAIFDILEEPARISARPVGPS